jgi:hypothetical protein
MGSYVETWKCIAFSVGRSERWCRYMARRPLDPLPVFKVGGIVRMTKPDLDAWLLRQREIPYDQLKAQAIASGELLAG